MWSQAEYDELREAVHDYFHEFGENPCEIVFQELIRHGTMAPMLARLDVADPANSDDQYAAILNFLRHYSIETFARILDNPKVSPAQAKREYLEKRRRQMSETASNRLLSKLRRRDDGAQPTEFDFAQLPPAPPVATPIVVPVDSRPAAVLRPMRQVDSKLPPAAKRQFARVKVDIDAVVHESSTEIPVTKFDAPAAPITATHPTEGLELHPPVERPATPPEINAPTPAPSITTGISLPRGFIARDDTGRAAATRKRPAVFQKVVAEPPIVRAADTPAE